jgi:hypothetical protein
MRLAFMEGLLSPTHLLIAMAILVMLWFRHFPRSNDDDSR